MKREKRSKLWRIMRGAISISLVISILDGCWVAAFYMTESYYGSIGWYPHLIVRSVINSTLAFVMFGLIMLIFGQFMRKRDFQYYKQLLDAMMRISKGDFSVSISMPGRGGLDNPWGKLIDSVNQMAADLGRMERMRQEFISNASHEIQSPLTSISGFARALQNESLSREERAHYLGIIEQESRRLSKLSESLLKLTSLESEHHPFEPKRYRLDKQLRNIVLACEPQWVEKGIELDVEMEETIVTADEDLLSQVWTNLLHNSIKFTPPGGTIGVYVSKVAVGEQVVEGRSKAENGDRGSAAARHVTVRISDTGIGVAESDLPHVFERFYKADTSRNRAAGGSGLGLAIAKKIVDMHHGEIAAESRLGEGTRFTITLPAEPPVAADVRGDDAAEAGGAGAPRGKRGRRHGA